MQSLCLIVQFLHNYKSVFFFLTLGVVNSFVHVVMYTYYMLAACGPQLQRYLWWKKYITVLQMVRIKTLHLSVTLFYRQTKKFLLNAIRANFYEIQRNYQLSHSSFI